MTTELANRFIEYETVKDVWDAVHKYHSKKNDRSKIAQLVSRSCALQQGEKSVLTYANELSDIYRELDYYRPLAHNSVEWEYILMDRVYRLLQGLRSEFEGIRGQLLSREAPLSFDNTITQLLNEESRLQEQKGVSECSVFAITDQKSIRPTQNGQSALPVNEIKKGQPKNRENQWCNYCKRKGHTKEKWWKLNGRPPQDLLKIFTSTYGCIPFICSRIL